MADAWDDDDFDVRSWHPRAVVLRGTDVVLVSP